MAVMLGLGSGKNPQIRKLFFHDRNYVNASKTSRVASGESLLMLSTIVFRKYFKYPFSSISG